jgi:plasmid stabilization system protein ParE
MPTSKLTLSADKDLIRQAKKLAAENGTSVSAMFAGLLRTMIRTRGAQEPTGQLTRKATGLIRLSSSKDDERLVEDALAAKYGMRR